MTTKARAALREPLDTDRLIIAPGVYDDITARRAKRTGRAAAYLTGVGVAAAGFGLPDIGLVTQTEMVERALMAVRALGEVPLLADADTGYGAPINVIRTGREYEDAGVAAIQLEDQVFPKRCGHLPDKELASAGDFVRTLDAALGLRARFLAAGRRPLQPPRRRRVGGRRVQLTGLPQRDQCRTAGHDGSGRDRGIHRWRYRHLRPVCRDLAKRHTGASGAVPVLPGLVLDILASGGVLPRLAERGYLPTELAAQLRLPAAAAAGQGSGA